MTTDVIQFEQIEHPYLTNAKAVREHIFTRWGNLERPLLSEEVSFREIRKVALILASSRGGSSLLFELLRGTDQILSLDGEHTPFYKLNGHNLSSGHLESDRVSADAFASEQDFDRLCRDLISGLGIGGERELFAFEDFKQVLSLRLPLQWPQLALSYEEWANYVERTYRRFCKDFAVWDTRTFFISLLHNLIEHYAVVNPYYYDLPGSLIQAIFPDLVQPEGPPNTSFCIEEPPFIVPRPRRRPTVSEILTKPLLLKASVDAYRLPYVRKLFPNAEFWVIHLARNPAASINGLYDGWLHHGFFSHNLEGLAMLGISGYSELSQWGKHWWNFDLPPGWREMINQPLEYVCGFQWYSAHKTILEDLEKLGFRKIIRVKFEDLLASGQQRYRTMGTIAQFIGIRLDDSLKAGIEEMPVVMATALPYNRRWLRRKELLWPVISQRHLVDLAEVLGYSLGSEDKWL